MNKFVVTMDMAVATRLDFVQSSNPNKDKNMQHALQQFVDRHNLRPATSAELIQDVLDAHPDASPTARAFIEAAATLEQHPGTYAPVGQAPTASPSSPCGVFRYSRDAINLAAVTEWADDGAVMVWTGVEDPTRLTGDDAARFIEVFSRWEVK